MPSSASPTPSITRPTTPSWRRPSTPSGPARPFWFGLDLVLSGPILRILLFFTCFGMANGGVQPFSVVALGMLWGTRAASANIALSGFLLMSAVGVLVGGVIADRTPHHERVAAVGFAFTAAMAIMLGWVNMPTAILIFVM